MKIELYTFRKKLYAAFVYRHDKTNETHIELKERIRAVPNISYDFENYRYKVNINHTSVKYVDIIGKYYMFDFPTEWQDIIDKYTNKVKENREMSEAVDVDDSFVISESKFTPYPFQLAGIKYLLHNPKSILGDEQGLGKTMQAILTFHTLNTYPVIISCPNSLKYNWKYEILKTIEFDADRISIIDNKPKDDFTKDIIIINYDVLNKFLPTLIKRKPHVLIYDESQKVKSSSSTRAQAAFKLSRKIPHRYLLTGTVVDDKPINLVQQLKILDMLQEFGGSEHFKTHFCDMQQGKWGMEYGASNTKELHQKLREICYLRRNKATVLTELPDKTYSKVFLDLKGTRKYNTLVKAALYTNHAKFRNNNSEFATLRKYVGEHKLDYSIKWIEDFLESGQKLVVFGHHRSVVEAIAEHFNCRLIYGDTDVEDRQKYVQEFQETDKHQLIVLNIAAGKEGLTLTAASNLVYVEPPITPGDALQSEDRIHRIGQKQVANIYYLLAKDTIDIHIYDLLMDKMKAAKMINAGLEFDESEIVTGDIADLIFDKI